MTKKSTSQKQLGIKELLLSLFLILVVWGAKEFLGIDLMTSTETTVESEPTGAMQVMFTAPRYPDDDAYHYGGLDEKLATAIDQSQQSVDVAAFDFDLERVAAALVRAKERGVQVRLVTDSDYEDELGPERLDSAGIPIVLDDRHPFMHNKFVVIDGYEVWTGSWNLTDNGTYRNNNNVIVVKSNKLAENYTVEFEEMFVDGEFGISSSEDTPHPQIDLNGTLVENVFEAEGDVRQRIIALVQEAEQSIYFMAFVFTDDDIAQAIIAQQRGGVKVQGIVEARNVNSSGSDVDSFLKSGVEVLEDGNPYIMHHKVIIIDEAIVITGSYNFSASAAKKNDENVLIIHNPEIAAQYVAEFERAHKRASTSQ